MVPRPYQIAATLPTVSTVKIEGVREVQTG